jgi:hypothetical protein
MLKYQPHWISYSRLTACGTICVMACTTAAAIAQSPQAWRSQAETALSVRNSTVQFLSFDETPDRAQSTTVILDGRPTTLILQSYSLRSPDFRVLIQNTVDGPLVEVPAPPVVTVRGTLQGSPGSQVRGTLIDGQLEAIVYTSDTVFGIQPLTALGIDAPPNAHVVYRKDDHVDAGNHQCGVEDDPMAEFESAPTETRRIAGTGLRIADIGLDADFTYYTINGSSVAATINDMETIINAVEPIYEVPEISVTYEITTCIVRTVQGPYTATNPNSLLNQFRNTWNSSPENDIRKDVAHLFTGKNIDGTTIGIASVGVICSSSSSYGLSQSRFTSSFTSRVALTAHELGHNWAAGHCNSSSPCRIMCSGLGGCNGLNPLTFSDAAIAQIGPYADSRNCVTPVAPALELPICEDFETPLINDDTWLYNDGAFASQAASNEPSGVRSMTLDSGGDLYEDDEVRTNFINLFLQSNVTLTFATQHVGVEAGESLIVEYWNSAHDWVQLDEIVSDGVNQSTFTSHVHVLPTPANHSEFRLRFRVNGDEANDDWYIDDVLFDCVLCFDPCDDDNVCTLNDLCDISQCLGTPVDCSGFDTDCATVTCDTAGTLGNCDTVTSVNNLMSCDGGDGLCYGGACLPFGDTRLFMAGAGEEAAAPSSGTTTIAIAAGSTRTVEVWLADPDPLIGGYQISIPGSAAPAGGATGTITYLDQNPGPGNSVDINTTDPTWVFANEPSAAVFVSETGLPDAFGLIAVAPVGIGVPVNGLAYAGEFQLAVSADASGSFTLDFIPVGQPPNGGTSLNDDTGVGPVPGLLQPLEIQVVEGGSCVTINECADVDSNGISDDGCKWYDCNVSTCTALDRIFGDAGGSFGACMIDGFANVHDRNLTLSCFAGTTPCAQINVDIGGAFGDCVVDGFCNVHDANLALAAFAGTTTCSCPTGPAPEFDLLTVVARNAIDMVAPRRVEAGTPFEVHAMLQAPLDDFRSYQLELDVSGGSAGRLQLTDIAVAPRRDSAFPRSQGFFEAFNVDRGQMLRGLSGDGIAVTAEAYLATFTLRASDDASGPFAVSIRPDGQTFLVASNDGRIAVEHGRAALIDVVANPPRKR